MRPFCHHTPSGGQIASHHVVHLKVELSGALHQFCSKVQATTLTGDKNVLGTDRGPDPGEARAPR